MLLFPSHSNQKGGQMFQLSHKQMRGYTERVYACKLYGIWYLRVETKLGIRQARYEQRQNMCLNIDFIMNASF